MRYLEEKFLETQSYKPEVWIRYIDDIFFVCKHGKDKLTHFITKANEYHPTIKFTAEYSPASINFLDTTVKKDTTGKLYTELYVKPTD